MGGSMCFRWVLVVIIVASLAPFRASALQDEEATAKTINIQIIVDSSGSMAAATPNGELRVDAAKRVLTQVVSEIPAVDGVNVGFRVYGHLGNNQPEGQVESCLSSDLVVPMSGVDVPALTQQINSLTPVGWTPLGLSLERAGSDFTDPASDDVVNAVVLVTDGLETCGGDPVQVAGDLHSSEQGITTHVIGFGTTNEELTILGGVAENGGGLLLGANDAGSLTSALFDILEELEVVQGVNFIGGNGLGLLGAGNPGEVSVLSHGLYDGNILPVVIRNNSGIDVIRPTMTVVARDGQGNQVAVGNDQMFNPNLVRSGGVSIGYAYFGGVSVPADATYEFSFSPTPATESQYENARDLEVVEASSVNGSIVGTLQNTYEATLDGPVGVSAACLDSNGNVTTVVSTFAEAPQIDFEAQVPFQATNYSGIPCEYFLVAGSAWDNSFGPNNSVLPPGEATPTVIPDVSVESPATCVDTTSAGEIVEYLLAAGVPIGEYEVYTAETDPNGLLGRPLQYTAKANFRDTRLAPEYAEFEYSDGGTVEVFDSAEDAQARYDYVMGVMRESPILVHYLYLDAHVLFRISARFTPEQASVYEEALSVMQPCESATLAPTVTFVLDDKRIAYRQEADAKRFLASTKYGRGNPRPYLILIRRNTPDQPA